MEAVTDAVSRLQRANLMKEMYWHRCTVDAHALDFQVITKADDAVMTGFVTIQTA